MSEISDVAMGDNYYEARARDVDFESITSSDNNALILEKLKKNDKTFKRMGIMACDDYEYWPDEDDFDVQEGDDLGWLGYFIGKSKQLESLSITHLPGDKKSFGQGLAQNQSIQELYICSDLGVAGFQTLAPFLQNTNTLEKLDFSMSSTSLEGAQNIALLLSQCQIRSLKTLEFTENNLTGEGFEEFARSLRAQPQLEELNLNGISREDAPFDQRGYVALGNTMKNWTSPFLYNLRIYGSDLRDDGLLTLVEGMANCVNLEHLDLSGNFSITVIGWRALSSLFRSKKFCLQSLDLDGMDINNEGMITLATGLAALQSLKCLDLSFNAIGDEGLQALAVGLSNNKNLQSLNLSRNRLFSAIGNGEGMVTLASGLATIESLKSLHLSNNAIGDEGLQALAAGLSNNNNLETLYLSNNGSFSVMGLRHLSDVIPTVMNLKALDLSGNAINDEGLEALAVGLKNHPTLEVLDLSSNSIGNEGLRALAGAEISSLCWLSLASNAINDEALDAFVEGIENFISLETLSLANNNMITSSGLAVLSTIFHRKSCLLKEIDLEMTMIEDNEAKAFAEGLVGNQSLERLTFCYRNVTAKGWSAFSTLLCDTSSVSNTYLSNHTLKAVGIRHYFMDQDHIPFSVRQYLSLNRQNQYDVPICKILMSHSNLDMTPFLQWKLKLLPFVLAWFERAQSCRTFLEQSITSFKRRELSAMYQFIHGLPLLAASGFNKRMSTKAHSKKRRFDLCGK